MNGLNKVMLIGRTGNAPEVRHLEDGTCVANIGLATGESYKNKAGEKVDKTEWHRVVFWKKLAEIVEKYVTKGQLLYVEGKIQIRKWQDKDGNEKFTTEIVANSMQMLSKNEAPKASSAQEPENKSNNAGTTSNQGLDDEAPF